MVKRHIILMYHGIGPASTVDRMALNTPLEKFVREVELLRGLGWRLSPIRSLLSENAPDHPCAAISFDDALQNQLPAAAFLDSIHVKATFFVPTGCLGSNLGGDGYWSAWKCMKSSDLEALHASGHEIGSHGTYHRGPLHRMPTHEIERELSGSREALALLTGTTRLGFSYPYGGFTGSLASMVQRAGYDYGACSCPAALSSRRDLFALPRIEIRGTDSLSVFQKKLRGQGEILRLLRYHLSQRLRS